jgi:hypothetical protein
MYPARKAHAQYYIFICCLFGCTTFFHIILINGTIFGKKSFIQVVCLTTGLKPLTKRALHIVRSRAFSFKWEYPLLSLRSSSSFSRLLPRLPVTYIPSFIFSSITRCRRKFLRKMRPIQFAFRLRILCRIFLCSLTLREKVTEHKMRVYWFPLRPGLKHF